jgi:hypothetical protein
VSSTAARLPDRPDDTERLRRELENLVRMLVQGQVIADGLLDRISPVLLAACADPVAKKLLRTERGLQRYRKVLARKQRLGIDPPVIVLDPPRSARITVDEVSFEVPYALGVLLEILAGGEGGSDGIVVWKPTAEVRLQLAKRLGVTEIKPHTLDVKMNSLREAFLDHQVDGDLIETDPGLGKRLRVRRAAARGALS